MNRTQISIKTYKLFLLGYYMEHPLAEPKPGEVMSKLLKTLLTILAIYLLPSWNYTFAGGLRQTLNVFVLLCMGSFGDITAGLIFVSRRYAHMEQMSESHLRIVIFFISHLAFFAFAYGCLYLFGQFNNRNTHTDNPKEVRPIRTSCTVLQSEVDRLAEPQTKNCTTNLMVKKIQTGKGQEVLDKSVTQPYNENEHIEEVIYDMQKLEKEMPDLELKKEGRHETKKLERKEQFKVNQQKLKQELPDVRNERTKFRMDVQQQQLYTAQQNLKADHQGLNKNQKQFKAAPPEKACNTRPMNTTAPNEIHHVEEPPSTQSYDSNMRKSNQKQGSRKEKAWNARSINTRGQNELCQLEEQPTAQSYNTKMYTNPPKQEHRGMKPMNTKPMNIRGQNEIRHLREQATTPFHDANVQELPKDIYNLKQENGDLQKKIEELLEKIKVGEDEEKETVQRLQCEGQLCDLNCVSLAILWICKHKLESMSSFCCAPHFETLITLHACLEGKLPHMPRCGYFMNTLQHVEIVRKVYECEMNGELEINEAWETLMKMNERVCILAKGKAQGVGHVVVCDLDTRTSKTKDGKVMFHDRQALLSSGRRRVEMSLQKFIEYVNNVSLMLYTVDLEELNRIMVYYKNVLHITELPHSWPRIE